MTVTNSESPSAVNNVHFLVSETIPKQKQNPTSNLCPIMIKILALYHCVDPSNLIITDYGNL